MKQKLLFKTAILIAMVALGINSFAQNGNAIAGGKPIDGGGGGVIIGPSEGGGKPIDPVGSTAPTITNNLVTNVTSSGATINFTVNPGNAATTVKVYYGTQSLDSSKDDQAGYNTNISSNGSIILTNLAPATTYQFRVEARNNISTALSPIATFTTLAAIPVYHFQFNGSLLATDGLTSFTYNPVTTPTYKNSTALVIEGINSNAPVISAVLPNVPLGSSSRTIHLRIKFSTDNNPYVESNNVFTYGSMAANHAYGWAQLTQQSVSVIGQPITNYTTRNIFWGPNDNDIIQNTLDRFSYQNFTFVYDGTTALVYKNGTQIGSKVITLNTVGTTFWLGSVLGNSRELVAELDDLQIFNTALTQAQITALNTTLPLTLTSLTAKAIATGNQINWTSASAINVKNIIIERSGADNTFTPLATLPTNATQYIDTNPLAGDNYYRLTSIDNDGTTNTYEKIALVKGLAQEISLYPNPVTNGVLNVVAGADALKSINIINLNGVKVASAQAINNPKNVVISTNGLAKGVYVLQITGAKTNTIKKIMIN
ncbi:MAG: T9SS C-terminal target domain-containing protein [Sphingobacteriales bacterium]|nr:MAG: T9SS C-terminal target domain-containing protein [Sphingobacteriales bacterium]